MTDHPQIAAVLWDMDGTLIDSEPSWITAEQTLAARFGVEWTHEDGMTLVGMPLPVSAGILRERGIDLPIPELIDQLVGTVAAQVGEDMPWLDDARTLLRAVREAGIRCALVTMSSGAFIDAFLAVAGDYFEVVVSGDQVTKGKPDPEAYLEAARRLGVDITQCVAIEDSDPGTRAAHASGAATIGVQRHTAVPDLPGMVRLSSLEGVGVVELGEILAAHRAWRKGAKA